MKDRCEFDTLSNTGKYHWNRCILKNNHNGEHEYKLERNDTRT